MRSMISGGKPEPSSAMTTVTVIGRPEAVDLDLLAREIDGVFQDVAEAVEDRRIARADRLAGIVLGDRDLDRDAHGRDAAPTTSSIRAESFMRSNGSPGAGSSVSLLEDHPAALRLLAQQADVLGMAAKSGSISRSSSRATTRMVESGVPSSWAAAAARPSSWER